MLYRSFAFICLCVAFLCSSCGQTAPVHDSRFQTEDYLIDYDVSPEYVNAEGTFCRYESTYYDIIGQWILYYDAAEGQWDKLCGKAECSHEDKSCNAFVDPLTFGIQIYDQKLYWLSGSVLYCADLDGSHREQVQQLGNMDGLNPRFYIHRGYVYTSRIGTEMSDGANAYTVEVMRYELGQEETTEKCIYKEYFEYLPMYFCRFDGNQIYILVDVPQGMYGKAEKCMRNLYAYDVSEQQIEQIWSTEESWSANNIQIRDHEIYFLDLRLDFLSTEGGIVRYSQFDPAARTMRNGEEIALEPGALGAYMVDGYLITSCYTADPEERYDRYWAYAEDHALVGTGSITHYAMPIGKDETGILMSAGGLAGGQLLRIPFADLDSPEVLLDFQDERVS